MELGCLKYDIIDIYCYGMRQTLKEMAQGMKRDEYRVEVLGI